MVSAVQSLWDCVTLLTRLHPTAAVSAQDMAMMGSMAPQMGSPGQQPDFTKLHKAESQNLQLAGLDVVEHAGKPSPPPGVRRWVGDGIESRVLALYAL